MIASAGHTTKYFKSPVKLATSRCGPITSAVHIRVLTIIAFTGHAKQYLNSPVTAETSRCLKHKKDCGADAVL